MKTDNFEEIYLQILNEEVSPTTFTPIELLSDIRDRCFYSHGVVIYYTIEELKDFSDDKNKPLFSLMLHKMKYNDDYAMLIIYFTSMDQLEPLMTTVGYAHPHMHYPQFSLNKVYTALKTFFKDSFKTGCHFNSIDTNPELGCVIALNGKNIHSNREFERELDHELNHYFEQMNIHYNLADYPDNIVDIKNEKILNKLEEFYHDEFRQKPSYIADLKTHLFNYNEFRSMSANVFHNILKYNETHLKQLQFSEFLGDIANCNYIKYKEVYLQETILFCWICKQISADRWSILTEGIKEAISIKKNIFQKFWIAGKDLLRRFLIKNDERRN